MTRRSGSRPAAGPVRDPTLPRELEPVTIETLSHDARYSGVELVNANLSLQHARGVRLATCKLTDIDLSGSELEHLSIADGHIAGCNLANVQARRAEAVRVRVETSRLTGIALTDATLHDVAFTGCRVDLASFGGCRMTRVEFTDCVLAQTDFLDAQLDSVRFSGCRLERSDFRGARLRHCEFRRNDLTGVQGIQSLAGAALEWGDIVGMAGEFAVALGIGVLDAD
jgi:uncharacterized protein YjbI with pentapeptide repeats